MIQIKKIEFINYRQYKNICIDFEQKSKYNLYVLKAQNGTGKTTFLNGILWCLYEQEFYSSFGYKSLPLVNDSVLERKNKGDEVIVSVKLTITDDDKYITFERIKCFSVTENPLNGIKNVIDGKKRFVVTITNLDGSNTKKYDNDEDTIGIVTQYFAEPIYEFYFFDGENLKNYFDLTATKSKKIEDSIFNIAQVNLLKTAIRHANDISAQKYNESERGRKDSQNLYVELNKKRIDLERLEQENIILLDNKPFLTNRIKEIDSILREYAPIAEKQKQRDELLKKLKVWQYDYDDFISERNFFVRKYLTLLNMYPLIKSTYDMIQEKKNSGKLPPNVNRRQLKDIIDEHVINCPVCNKKIDRDALDWIAQLLKTVDVSPTTSNFLVEINASLEKFIDDCHMFESNRDIIIKKEQYLNQEKNELDEKLNNISSYLSNLGNAADEDEEKKRISALEREREEKRRTIETNERRIALNEGEIGILKTRIQQLESDINYNESKMDQSNKLKKQVAVLRKIQTEYEKIKEDITSAIKREIQEVTWNVFDKMIWKSNTFGKIEIDDKYKISVFNTNGREMTGSISATEKMALAYSFTLAIHEASGKNCPLVVDSPLGRVSDINRENMAKELLKVSLDKQIIMLFTPDEYSKEVKDIYDMHSSSVREILLSNDENEIAKVGM